MQVDGVDQGSVDVEQDRFGHRAFFLSSLVSTKLLLDLVQDVPVRHPLLPAVGQFEPNRCGATARSAYDPQPVGVVDASGDCLLRIVSKAREGLDARPGDAALVRNLA